METRTVRPMKVGEKTLIVTFILLPTKECDTPECLNHTNVFVTEEGRDARFLCRDCFVQLFDDSIERQTQFREELREQQTRKREVAKNEWGALSWVGPLFFLQKRNMFPLLGSVKGVAEKRSLTRKPALVVLYVGGGLAC